MINFHPGSNDELKPRISVIGVGGAGGNAVNNMIQSHLEGVEFIVANTDAQAMAQSRTDRRIQLGLTTTQGLGAGARPDIGRAAAEESLDELMAELTGSNMVFITAGMGGGTGTGAAPVIARAAREHGILTVGVVTKPFSFEGQHRLRLAEQGIDELSQYVDTLIIIPNQNLFRVASERTTFADAFKMADDVLYAGVRGVTDLMIKPGLINLDFADIRTVMGEMGKAVMGTGEAEGDKRALDAAEAAINNPLLEDLSMKGARGVLINITGGLDMTLFEADEAANRIRDEVDPDANIIFGSTFDENMSGRIRVSVVATGIDAAAQTMPKPTLINLVDQKPSARPAAPAANVQSFQPKAPTLAERVAGTPSFFNGSAAVAQPTAQPAVESEEPVVAQAAILEDEQEQELAQAEPVLQVREPAPAARDSFSRPEPAPAMRAEPTMSLREPAQGSLRMEQPAPRADLRAELQADARQAPEPIQEARRPAGLFNRLAGHIKPSSATHGHPGHAHSQALAQGHAAQPAAAHRPAPQAETPVSAAQPTASTRISPNDRLQTSRSSDEDLLDIPAFLRRQAN
ncbi:MAG TPA: cell division protein FtsZ [Candidatus Sulfotelmatobacter sp.]|jgi:cell division protein FtsZ|nr:cell division protein FtsZ [Candidatus Sulfotelmatobacter sp.]